jgi:hypothetical protein
MRYYVYVSDAKIDMLYSQIPRKLLSRIVAELNLDFKVLGVAVRKRETDETLYSKLDVVERYLDDEIEVGSVTEPATWFGGELPLRSGVWEDGGPGGWEARPTLAFFSGLQDGVLVALIGSTHHLIGQQADPSAIQVSYSALPALFSVLARDAAGSRSADSRGFPSMPDDDRSVIREVFKFADAQTGVRQPSQFLARRLLHGPVEVENGTVQRVLLGTPLYVALTED